MSFSNILLAFDGSKASRKALDKTVSLAKDSPSSKITVVHVIQGTAIVAGEAFVTVSDEMQKQIYEHSAQLLEEAKLALAPLSNPSEYMQLEGPAAKAILDCAEEQGCDLIVIGSRGLGGIREWVLGSVSHNVVQHAKIPVLVVK